MGIVIPLPGRHRCRPPGRRPFDRVHVIRGEGSEVWTIAGSTGWLHGSFGDAVNDAVEVAAGFGVPIAVEVPHA